MSALSTVRVRIRGLGLVRVRGLGLVRVRGLGLVRVFRVEALV